MYFKNLVEVQAHLILLWFTLLCLIDFVLFYKLKGFDYPASKESNGTIF